MLLSGIIPLAALTLLAPGCEELDDNLDDHTDARYETPAAVPLEDVAKVLSMVPVGAGQMEEVADAVKASSVNGYDEEYTMKDLFGSPGAGVGDDALPTRSASSGKVYERPLRDLLREAAADLYATRGSVSGDGEMTPDKFVEALSDSDVQIYWPYSERWDGKSLPIITYDPADGSSKVKGYYRGKDGIEEIDVDEDLARERPVWVVNRNDDSSFKTLEMLRREDPHWAEGGTIIVRGGNLSCSESRVAAAPLGSDSGFKSLILKSFAMKRNYDVWLAGASEFFVKCGSVEGFTASTDAEIALYFPAVSEFMVVVRRSQVGEDIPFNAVLVSDWTDQLETCAFIITEDDGGTRTSWNCSATVKYSSKAYGFEIAIPVNSRDDIVWRGQLSRRYIEKYNGIPGHFGDVDIVLELK